MFQLVADVVDNARLADRTFRLRLGCPPLAAAVRPGQFVMLRPPGGTDPLLGRPFAVADTFNDPSGRPAGIDVIHLVVGRVTGKLAGLRAGDAVSVWGPLGKPFPDYDGVDRVALVAGGIGQTPFLAYARHLLGGRGYGGDAPRRRAGSVALYYGVRTAGLAAGVDDFRRAGAAVHLASDDGSVGRRGFVTDLLEEHGPAGPLVGCGPSPMLRALTALAARWGADCHVSLETPMACGVGVCFSCVAEVRTADGRDYKRVCVDGPTFPAADLVWE